MVEQAQGHRDTIGPGHLSNSQLDLWDKCPRAWEYRYLHGMRTPSSGALVEGDCYHKALEENFRFKLKTGEDLDVEIALDVLSTYWDRVVSEMEVDWEGRNPSFLKDECAALVAKYIEEVSPSITPRQVEQWYERDLGGVKFVLRMDLMDDKMAVIDHKTSNKRYSQDDVDKDMQASASAFVLGRSIIFYNHIAVKAAKPDIQIIKTYRTQDDIDWWYDKAIKTARLMQTGMCPPRTEGWYCSPKYCDFFEDCRGHLTKALIGWGV